MINFLKTRKILLFAFFSLLLFLYAFCSAREDLFDNQLSRYALTRSISLKGSFEVQQADCMSDWSFNEGRYYSNKAPGSSYLAVPIYLTLYHVEKMFRLDVDKLYVFNFKVISFFFSTIPTVLICIFMYLFFLNQFPSLENKLLIISAYSLGTLAFPLSTNLWGYQLAAFFLFLSYYFIKVSRKYFFAGLFIGFAVFTEYPVALLIPAYFILIAVISFKSQNKKNIDKLNPLLFFILGGLIPLALLMHYHYVCFGSVFSTPYAFENPIYRESSGVSLINGSVVVGDFSQLMNNNSTFLGVNYDALLKLLFGFKKGLFLIYPITVLGVLGIFRKKNYLCIYAFLSFLILNATLLLWEGGWFAGPRYLATIVPFLFIEPVFFKKSLFFYFFLFLSILNTVAIVSVNIMVPNNIEYFLYEIIYPGILDNILRFSFITVMVVSILFIAYLEHKQTKKEH